MIIQLWLKHVGSKQKRPYFNENKHINKNMRDNNLLASVVLFRELYDNEKDIYDVLAEFLLAAINYSKKWTFNSTELTDMLEDTFDFKIPEAVVKTTLKNRLSKDGLITFADGLYSIVSEKLKKQNDFSNEFEQNRTVQSRILLDLVLYIENKLNTTLSDKEKEHVFQNFHSYIFDSNGTDKYSCLISSFIVENQKNQNFTSNLNAIKEGLILYNGIRYTSNLNELGKWNSELTIFLDTEHLFNATGYNGILYQEIFDDFYKLVKEINLSNKGNSNKKRVELKYFKEIEDDIENFFHVAELIIEGKVNLNPSKTAMLTIINGCRTKSDILRKKTKFFSDLNNMNINYDEKLEYNIHPQYNVEDLNIIEALKKKSVANKKYFEEEECIHFLKIFSKINSLRRGVSDVGFERIGYILMSGKSVAHYIAHSPEVKFKEKDIPFATDIDFITNKFWFKLKKGFGDKNGIPKSFDIVTKAQIVLSSQINSSVYDKYNLLTEQYEQGIVTKEEAVSYHNELRDNVRNPEEIIPESIEDSLIFIANDGINSYRRKISNLEQIAKKGEEAILELKRREIKDWLNKKAPLKKRIYRESASVFFIINVFIIAIMITIFLIIYKLKTPNDTILSIISLSFAIIVEIITYLSLYKKILYKLQSRFRDKYKVMLVALK
jgi:hypothetical protein